MCKYVLNALNVLFPLKIFIILAVTLTRFYKSLR